MTRLKSSPIKKIPSVVESLGLKTSEGFHIPSQVQGTSDSNDLSQPGAPVESTPVEQKKARKIPNRLISKPRRYKPGTVALREIRKYQKSSNLLLAKGPFEKLVREIAAQMRADSIRFKPAALEALQESAEAYLTELFESSQEAAIHANRITVNSTDVRLVRKIRREPNYFMK